MDSIWLIHNLAMVVSTAAQGTVPCDGPDNFCITIIEQQVVGGVTVKRRYMRGCIDRLFLFGVEPRTREVLTMDSRVDTSQPFCRRLSRRLLLPDHQVPMVGAGTVSESDQDSFIQKHNNGPQSVSSQSRQKNRETSGTITYQRVDQRKPVVAKSGHFRVRHARANRWARRRRRITGRVLFGIDFAAANKRTSRESSASSELVPVDDPLIVCSCYEHRCNGGRQSRGTPTTMGGPGGPRVQGGTRELLCWLGVSVVAAVNWTLVAWAR